MYEYEGDTLPPMKLIVRHRDPKNWDQVDVKSYVPNTDIVLPDGEVVLKESSSVQDEYGTVRFYWRIEEPGAEPIKNAHFRQRIPPQPPGVETVAHFVIGQVMVARFVPKELTQDMNIREMGFIQLRKYEFTDKVVRPPEKQKVDWDIDGFYLPQKPFYERPNVVIWQDKPELRFEHIMYDVPGLGPGQPEKTSAKFDFNTWFFFSAAIDEPEPLRHLTGVLEWQFNVLVVQASPKTGIVTGYVVKSLPPTGGQLKLYKSKTKRTQWYVVGPPAYWQYWPSE